MRLSAQTVLSYAPLPHPAEMFFVGRKSCLFESQNHLAAMMGFVSYQVPDKRYGMWLDPLILPVCSRATRPAIAAPDAVRPATSRSFSAASAPEPPAKIATNEGSGRESHQPYIVWYAPDVHPPGASGAIPSGTYRLCVPGFGQLSCMVVLCVLTQGSFTSWQPCPSMPSPPVPAHRFRGPSVRPAA